MVPSRTLVHTHTPTPGVITLTIISCGLYAADLSVSASKPTTFTECLERRKRVAHRTNVISKWHHQVYDILVKECRAYDGPSERIQFAHHFPDCIEYRFVGALGFGGKVWSANQKLYVTCYKEDETPERMGMIFRANVKLSLLDWRESNPWPKSTPNPETPT